MELSDFFSRHPKTALAFSGGTDSSFLLYAGTASGADVRAYYVNSPFQPRFEMEDAEKVAERLRVPMTVIELDVLSSPLVASNPPDRCYHCKKMIFSAIKERAAADGYDTLIDGTNASDDLSDRPGARAVEELGVLSPLRECGLEKADIRALSKKAGLFTWKKPAYACLATRIPCGEEITAEKLENTEKAEDFLFSLGFSDFRVRLRGGAALIQAPENQLEKLAKSADIIAEELKKYYPAVFLDMEARK